MALKVSKPSSGSGDGIFIDKVVISKIEILSGKTTDFLKNPYDCCIEVSYVKSGLEWQPSFIIGGNFKRDEQTGAVVDWGGAFVVRDFFGRLGIDAELSDENEITEEMWNAALDKEMLVLTYRTTRKRKGKFTYNTWKEIGAVEDGEDDLRARFIRSAKRGYPKNVNMSGEVHEEEPWNEESQASSL